MAELHVQELLTDTSVELKRIVRGDMSVDLRTRHISHTIADFTDRILRTPGVNTRGFCATVTESEDGNFVVVASAPIF